jgi:misacylated tRNA(Ala) deacylase
MSRYLCHDRPEILDFATAVANAEPGKVLFRETFFYPGGGGQLADRGRLAAAQGEFNVTGMEARGGEFWHVLDRPVELHGDVQASVDPLFRHLMCELHTDLHIVNALVFQTFDGALVTGVQMVEDGTARIDFDLPEVDNDRLRALEPAINDAIRADLKVGALYASRELLDQEPGLLRSRSVAPPPQPDGSVRVIEIAGLDRQACGGTHLLSTGMSRPLKILKIDNKGKHNRRMRIALI